MLAFGVQCEWATTTTTREGNPGETHSWLLMPGRVAVVSCLKSKGADCEGTRLASLSLLGLGEATGTGLGWSTYDLDAAPLLLATTADQQIADASAVGLEDSTNVMHVGDGCVGQVLKVIRWLLGGWL